MNIFDPVAAPIILALMLITQPIFYIPATLAVIGVWITRIIRRRKFAKGGHVVTMPKDGDSVPILLLPGTYSLDGGRTWHTAEDFAERLREDRLRRERRDRMEADQFGGFDRTPRYRHKDK